MNNGLPFFPAMVDYNQGTIARSFAPARAALQRRLSTTGPLPSGFREQALSDFDAAKARAFDDSLVGALSANEQAKQSGAAGLMGQAQIAAPQGYYNAAMSGNQSIMQAPLQSPGVAGLLGGLAGGAVSAIPF